MRTWKVPLRYSLYVEVQRDGSAFTSGISTCSLSFDSDVNNYYARFSYQNIMYAFYGYKRYW